MNLNTKDLLFVLRKESDEEKKGMPVPMKIERDQAFMLLPNTPLNYDAALDYGALMFALGRRQVTLEVKGWMRDNKLDV